MLLNEQLYFSNIISLTDKNEGTVPLLHPAEILGGTPSSSYSKMKSISGRKITVGRLISSGRLLNIVKKAYVNCWSMNREESYALWKIYLKGNPIGVAIKSTIGKLKESINNKENDKDFYIGKVQYTRYLDKENVLTLVTRKTLFYDYEKELRLIIIDTQKDDSLGKITLNIDLNILIEKIYISPFTPKWFIDSLFTILAKFNNNQLEEKIAYSEIKDK